MPVTPTTCSTCNGTGFVDGDFCPECFGQGTSPPSTTSLYVSLVKRLFDLEDKQNDIMEKCTEIMNKLNE